jgi:hypothetical protein
MTNKPGSSTASELNFKIPTVRKSSFKEGNFQTDGVIGNLSRQDSFFEFASEQTVSRGIDRRYCWKSWSRQLYNDAKMSHHQLYFHRL